MFVGKMSVTIRKQDMVLINMVETAIKQADTYLTVEELWNMMSKKMTYLTFLGILAYLKQHNKIVVDQDRSIIWIYADKPETKRLISELSDF